MLPAVFLHLIGLFVFTPDVGHKVGCSKSFLPSRSYGVTAIDRPENFGVDRARVAGEMLADLFLNRKDLPRRAGKKLHGMIPVSVPFLSGVGEVDCFSLLVIVPLPAVSGARDSTIFLRTLPRRNAGRGKDVLKLDSPSPTLNSSLTVVDEGVSEKLV